MFDVMMSRPRHSPAERKWSGVRAASAPPLPPVSSRLARPASVGRRHSGRDLDRDTPDELLVGRVHYAADVFGRENAPNELDDVTRRMPVTSSSAKDSRPQSVHSVHEERGQPVQSRSGLAAAGATSARPVRPVSARPLVGGKLEDDPYYSFWLKQTQSKTGGVISAKRPSSRPRSALPQARETDLEDVWVAPRAEGLPSYDPVKDKHLESYFQRYGRPGT